MDAFVITNHATKAECYRYQSLANSQSDIGTKVEESKGVKNSNLVTGAFGLTALRSALVEWSVTLGEICKQVVEGNFSGIEPTGSKNFGEVLILCEQSLFLLKVRRIVSNYCVLN
jgi:hypothetical protein